MKFDEKAANRPGRLDLRYGRDASPPLPGMAVRSRRMNHHSILLVWGTEASKSVASGSVRGGNASRWQLSKVETNLAAQRQNLQSSP
jgi:hypothetical protein